MIIEEEEASPLAPKRERIELNVAGTQRRRLKKKNTPSPQVPETILEEAEEEGEQIEFFLLR